MRRSDFHRSLLRSYPPMRSAHCGAKPRPCRRRPGSFPLPEPRSAPAAARLGDDGCGYAVGPANRGCPRPGCSRSAVRRPAFRQRKPAPPRPARPPFRAGSHDGPPPGVRRLCGRVRVPGRRPIRHPLRSVRPGRGPPRDRYCPPGFKRVPRPRSQGARTCGFPAR